MNKQQRHLAIKQIISESSVKTQKDLASALKKSGFKTTQATLSRDMTELGIAWVYTPNGARYMLSPEQEEERLTSLIGLEIENILSNETMIVIKTLPGRAQGVAEIIDRMRMSSILGTLAGDNTVFVLPKSIKKINDTMKNLHEILSKTK